MANSIAKILDRFFDNKMEDFETAFPAVIDAVNDGRIPKSRHDSYVKLFELLKNKSPYQR